MDSKILEGGVIPDPVLQGIDMEVLVIAVYGIEVVAKEPSDIVTLITEDSWGTKVNAFDW